MGVFNELDELLAVLLVVELRDEIELRLLDEVREFIEACDGNVESDESEDAVVMEGLTWEPGKVECS